MAEAQNDAQTIEGTCEELQERLQSFPKEQRFRLIPVSHTQEVNPTVHEETSLAELFAGQVGRFHFGNANLSQSSGEKFAALDDCEEIERATVTLTDTGPLIALVDADDAAHTSCVAALPRLTRLLLTTWPCFAMYLVGSEGGYASQEELWGYLKDGLVQIHDSSIAERLRMRVLMRQYHDTPMDLADASLVAAAEVLGITRIFTIDFDFRVYRIHRNIPFEIIP